MSINNESHKIALNALVKMHGDLIYEIGEYEKELQKKRALLFQTREVMRAMDPAIALDALPARHRRGTKSPDLYHGELSERIMDGLRESPDKTTTTEALTMTAMRDKGLNSGDLDRFKDLESRFRLQFNALRRAGVVKKVDGRGRLARWRLTAKAGGTA